MATQDSIQDTTYKQFNNSTIKQFNNNYSLFYFFRTCDKTWTQVILLPLFLLKNTVWDNTTLPINKRGVPLARIVLNSIHIDSLTYSTTKILYFSRFETSICTYSSVPIQPLNPLLFPILPPVSPPPPVLLPLQIPPSKPCPQSLDIKMKKEGRKLFGYDPSPQ